MFGLLNRRVVILLGITATIVAGVLYFALDPAAHPFPRCPVLTLTGLQCPGCGSQRALHALLHGHVGLAWGLNPMLFVALPAMLAAAVAETWPARFTRLHRLVQSRAFILTLLTAIILWTIVRNIP